MLIAKMTFMMVVLSVIALFQVYQLFHLRRRAQAPTVTKICLCWARTAEGNFFK